MYRTWVWTEWRPSRAGRRGWSWGRGRTQPPGTPPACCSNNQVLLSSVSTIHSYSYYLVYKFPEHIVLSNMVCGRQSCALPSCQTVHYQAVKLYTFHLCQTVHYQAVKLYTFQMPNCALPSCQTVYLPAAKLCITKLSSYIPSSCQIVLQICLTMHFPVFKLCTFKLPSFALPKCQTVYFQATNLYALPSYQTLHFQNAKLYSVLAGCLTTLYTSYGTVLHD